VDRADALLLLPEAYGEALRLRDAGSDDAAIAAILGIDADSVGALLTIGEAKLATLLGRGDRAAR
jgi:hypothetical protein